MRINYSVNAMIMSVTKRKLFKLNKTLSGNCTASIFNDFFIVS